MKKLVYQGSVKDIYEKDDALEFHFSDRFSIFDWGQMPDDIPHKGEYLNQIATYFFHYLKSTTSFQNIAIPNFLSENKLAPILTSKTLSKLQTKGLATHFIKSLGASSFLAKKFQVIKPPYIDGNFDYSQYSLAPSNTIIPLEVVFRLGVPTGSSLLQRNLADFKRQQRISVEISPDIMLDNICVEFYTKLEPTDRLLTNKEAQKISGLTDLEFNELRETTKILALVLFQKFNQLGFTLWDGKFEFSTGQEAKGSREIILIDSIGPDELRLTHSGVPYSKEVLRQFYLDSEWYQELAKAKKRDLYNFKKIVSSKPIPLTQQQIELAEYVYYSIANSIQYQQKYVDVLKQAQLKKHFQNIVIFGKGGREHALAKCLAKESCIQKIYVIPGNAGMSGHKIRTKTITESEYIDFCQKHFIDMAILGPENLIASGLGDKLQASGIPTMAPTQAAAQLESSKVFAKNLMKKFNIPTAQSQSFHKLQDALQFIAQSSWDKFVVKQSGLAAGKGVIICSNKKQACKASRDLLDCDQEILIEEFLEGRELSLFALCLNQSYQILGHACDYKRLNNNNQGPNTGGMGCYAPAHWLSTEALEQIEKTIILPTLKAMEIEGYPFQGVLFVGIMMTHQGPKVLEFNVRFGDPETQTLLPLVKSGLFEILSAIAHKDKILFHQSRIELSSKRSIHIIKAAKGYPGFGGEHIETNVPLVHELKENENLQLYFAGVKRHKNQLLTDGGRVLGITVIDNDLTAARNYAYRHLPHISFEGEQFREDIGL